MDEKSEQSEQSEKSEKCINQYLIRLVVINKERKALCVTDTAFVN